MHRVFSTVAKRTSYCFAFVPFVAASGYFAASYAFFIVYLSVERFEPQALEAFVLVLGASLLLCTVLHAWSFGAFEASGARAGLGLPRRVNAAFRRFQGPASPDSTVLEALLSGLARLPGYHMRVAAVLAAGVTGPSVAVEYAVSRSLRHLASGVTGGVIAGILYCYFCYVITETLSSELREACRRRLLDSGARLPQVYGASLRSKILVAVGIVFFSMGMLVYFLWFCRASLLLTLGFLVMTFSTVVVLVWLHFRSVKAAFDRILRTARSVSSGEAELLYLGNNEKELLEFAEHFNVAVRETIALRRNLEAQVSARTLDLAVKAQELERANGRLQELDRLKSRFLSSVSHELRTPLTAILGFARIVRRDVTQWVLPKLCREDRVHAKAVRIEGNLDVIQEEGNRLTRLINDVLDLARIESGRMEWHDRDLQVGWCVEQAVGLMRGAIEHRSGVSLCVDVEEPLPVVRADPDRIIQVLVNLLGNALKFTEDGEVRVRAAADRGGVRIAVEDTGKGLDAGDLERLFERFHQGGSSRGSGTGLGLAICREIVEHYGGVIGAEPRRGMGSRFVFTVPGSSEDVNVEDHLREE